jgi:alcohol dehydrogenase
MSETRASVLTGVHQAWTTEMVDIAQPHAREVRVQTAWAGLCHSDEHLRHGDMDLPDEVLQLMNLESLFPIVGGHEGSGIVTEVGPGVTQVSEGDHVAMSFVPSCGTCFWCASGRQNLCDLSMYTLGGPMISDGTYRYHLDGRPLNRMAQLGTFANELVVHENSLVRIDPWHDLSLDPPKSRGEAASL